MNVTDVDRTICKCAQWGIHDFIEPLPLSGVFQVDIDGPEPVWLCICCLVGLEEW